MVAEKFICCHVKIHYKFVSLHSVEMGVYMTEQIIKTKSLCKSYAVGGVQNHVLRNLDFSMKKADFTVVMGSSGCGKSTFLYCVSGMEYATSGPIFYLETSFGDFSEKELAMLRRKDFGFIFQHMHLVQNLTVFENIAVTGYLVDKPKIVHSKVYDLLDRMNLRHLEKRLPTQLSGGEQQRVAIARALINSPGVLFADEPTGSLNSQVGQDILNLLTDFHQNGQSILMVTHDVKAALRGQRIVYMKDGKFVGDLSLGSYVSTNAEEREHQVIAWLSAMGW